MSLAEICSEYINSENNKNINIIDFVESNWGLKFGKDKNPSLYPVQKFILKCYYNIPLDDKERNIIIKDKFNEKELYRFTEKEYLNFLWNEGRINIKELITDDLNSYRPNLILVIGRRGFKTSTIALIVAYETYCLLKRYSPQEYFQIPLEDEIRISCIATNQEQASELFRRICGLIEQSDFFKPFRHAPTKNFMLLSTRRDIEKYRDPTSSLPSSRPSIRIVAAPCNSRGIRGHNNIVAIMDEMAHFFEEKQSEDRSDAAIYNAITPSVVKFNSPEGIPCGRIICISSPLEKTGKFYELYQRSFDPNCQDLLMIQAPTWEIDYKLPSRLLRAKYHEDPVIYSTEYGAQFLDHKSPWLENEQYLRANIIPGLREKIISYERVPHFIGIDVGLKNDGTAIAVTHIVKQKVNNIVKDFIELDYCQVRYASKEGKEHFHIEDIVNWIEDITKKFFIVDGLMDQEYGLAIIPMLNNRNINQIKSQHFTRELNSIIYQNLMTKILDASLRIPEHFDEYNRKVDHPLVQELLKLRVTVHAKYLITVEASDERNAHDDLADAFARSVYLATNYINKNQPILTKPSSHNINLNASYRNYLLRQKRSSIYTNRIPPTSALTPNSLDNFWRY